MTSIKDIYCFNARSTTIEDEILKDVGKASLRLDKIEISVRYEVDSFTKKPIKHGLEVLVNILKDIVPNKLLFHFTLPGVLLGIKDSREFRRKIGYNGDFSYVY
jgi:hypothetical protein